MFANKQKNHEFLFKDRIYIYIYTYIHIYTTLRTAGVDHSTYKEHSKWKHAILLLSWSSVEYQTNSLHQLGGWHRISQAFRYGERLPFWLSEPNTPFTKPRRFLRTGALGALRVPGVHKTRFSRVRSTVIAFLVLKLIFRESGSRTIRRLWWMAFGVETAMEVGKEDASGLLKSIVLSLELVKQLWRDSKRRGFGEFVGWVRYLSQYWREFVPRRWNSCGYGAFGKFEWWRDLTFGSPHVSQDRRN